VVVQKSLAEGFGLTVVEALYKRRAVVASAVGGIVDQIVDGESGVLLADPTDLGAFTATLSELLADNDRRQRLGAAGHARVVERFLPDRHLHQWWQVLNRLLDGR
jgi:trehalose synthase